MRFELHKWLKDYRGIDYLKSYVRRVTTLTVAAEIMTIPESEVSELARVFGSPGSEIRIGPILTAGLPTVTGAVIPRPVAPPEDPPQYVNEGLIKELGAKQGHTRLSPDKLLQLLRELNACFRDGHAYACHALVRAIIDHVPPILGCQSFEQAASSYKWTKTDKKYVQRLLDFKVQADDVMHRHIRTSRGVITMHDLPNSGYINALLRECIDKLQ